MYRPVQHNICKVIVVCSRFQANQFILSHLRHENTCYAVLYSCLSQIFPADVFLQGIEVIIYDVRGIAGERFPVYHPHGLGGVKPGFGAEFADMGFEDLQAVPVDLFILRLTGSICSLIALALQFVDQVTRLPVVPADQHIRFKEWLHIPV